MASIAQAYREFQFLWGHPANQKRRLRQLLRAANFHMRARLFGQSFCAPLGRHGARIWVQPHRAAATKVLYGNPPDWPEMLVWERMLNPGDLFIDIGANIGSYAIFCASLGAHVIAIEPAPDTVTLLKENIALNAGLLIEIVEAAASDRLGFAAFTSGLDSTNRLDPHGAHIVDVTTLDQIIGSQTVAGLKIDVEGSELDVLKGGLTALQDNRIRLLQLEWNHLADRTPISKLLSAHGYVLLAATDDGKLVTTSPSDSDHDLFAAPALLKKDARSSYFDFTESV